MSKKLKLIDVDTREERIFNTRTDAARWINEKMGLRLQACNILYGITNHTSIAKHRYIPVEVAEEPVEVKPKPITRHETKGDWEFWQFDITPSVIVAEKHIDYYNEDIFDLLHRRFRRKGCHFVYEVEKYKKNGTRIEIYKKYDKEVPFEDKMDDLLDIIDNININATDL